MSRRALLTLLGIILLAAGSTWLSRAPQKPAASTTAASERYPSYFMRDFTAITMDEEGQPKHHLQAASLIHYSDDDTTVLARPRLSVLGENSKSWLIQAERGTADTSSRQLQLNENVILERPGEGAASDNLRISTDSLQVDLDRKYAQTDEPVHIADTNSTMDAVGMRAYLDQERVELLANVRGHYVPN